MNVAAKGWIISQSNAADQAKCTPIYEEMPGWTETTYGARSWAELPANAVKYIRRVEELTGIPVALIDLSTSPERDDTLKILDRLKTTPYL